MLLQALYEFARKTTARHGGTLLEHPEFESHRVAWLIDLKTDGSLQGFVPLSTDKDVGREYSKVPRTLEPKDSGTVAEFLVEDPLVILGLGESSSTPMEGKALKKHQYFWKRIEEAAEDLKHPGLGAILKWKKNHLTKPSLGNPVYEQYARRGGRAKPKEQWVVTITSGIKEPLYVRPNASIDATFRIGGNVIVLDEDILAWWTGWFNKWLERREEDCRKAHGGGRVCVLTGDVDAPISNSHLPKIKCGGVFRGTGATLASAEADSFHSYELSEQIAKIPGTRTGPDASYTNISVRGAMGYCNALNYLLENEKHRFLVGPTVVCFWARDLACEHEKFGELSALFERPDPTAVKKFLGAPYAGIDRALAKKDLFYSVALTSDTGEARVAVQHWMQETLEQAVENFQQWFKDLEIEAVWRPGPGEKKVRKRKAVDGETVDDKEGMPPLAIFRLACSTVRDPKDLQADVVTQLYRAALERTAPSPMFLKPILHEFKSALVKDSKDRPTYPFSLSRFALLKLILNRNRKEGDPMIEAKVFETDDEAYNCGGLLAVLAETQAKAHEYGLQGPGVAERYYGTASTSPATVFPLLLRLNRHHFEKMSQAGHKYHGHQRYLEQDIECFVKKFRPREEGASPEFPKILTLQEQGRFAIGFYQQRAKYAEEKRKHSGQERPGV